MSILLFYTCMRHNFFFMETRTTKVSKIADSRNYLSVRSSVGNHADQNNILATLYVFG